MNFKKKSVFIASGLALLVAASAAAAAADFPVLWVTGSVVLPNITACIGRAVIFTIDSNSCCNCPL